MAPYQGFPEPVAAQKPSRKVNIDRFLNIAASVGLVLGVGFLLLKLYQTFVMKSAPREQVIMAPAGKVIEDFPSGLIVEPNVAVQKSYSIHYNGMGTAQPVVSYVSSLFMYQNVDAFSKYLAQNGWKILTNADRFARMTFFYAEKHNYKEEVNITLEQQVDKKVHVTISYVAR